MATEARSKDPDEDHEEAEEAREDLPPDDPLVAAVPLPPLQPLPGTSFTLLQACEVYSPPDLVRDPSLSSQEPVPFEEVPGEFTRFMGIYLSCREDLGPDSGEEGDPQLDEDLIMDQPEGQGVSKRCLIAVSNYRLHWAELGGSKGKGLFCLGNLPLGLVESLEMRDQGSSLQVLSKDGRCFRIDFQDPGYGEVWHSRLSSILAPPSKVEQVFAFAHFAWAREVGFEENVRRGHSHRVRSLSEGSQKRSEDDSDPPGGLKGVLDLVPEGVGVGS